MFVMQMQRVLGLLMEKKIHDKAKQHFFNSFQEQILTK